MPRFIEPERWERYYEYLQHGYGRYEAARKAGISRNAALSFLNGDPQSSGMKWWHARQAMSVCPACGFRGVHPRESKPASHFPQAG